MILKKGDKYYLTLQEDEAKDLKRMGVTVNDPCEFSNNLPFTRAFTIGDEIVSERSLNREDVLIRYAVRPSGNTVALYLWEVK